MLTVSNKSILMFILFLYQNKRGMKALDHSPEFLALADALFSRAEQFSAQRNHLGTLVGGHIRNVCVK